MRILDRVLGREKEQSRRRKYKVRRGAGARVARATGLSEGHVSQCINGKREPSPTLYESLLHEERIFREGTND